MADSAVGGLTQIATIDGTDELYFNDGGVGKRGTLTQLLAYIRANGTPLRNASVAAQSPTANTDTYIVGTSITIPQARMVAGVKYKAEMMVTKTAAGTGTPTVNLRYGTAGAVGDTSRVLLTWPAANTAVADEMKFTVIATFRAVGSGTTAIIEAGFVAEHELTTTGFGGTGLGSNIIVNNTSGGFDSTVAGSILGISINAGTAGAWTFRQVHTILENLL